MNERVRELVRGANSRANWNARPPRHGGPGSPATPSGVHSVATRLSLDVHLGLACRGTSRAVSVPFFLNDLQWIIKRSKDAIPQTSHLCIRSVLPHVPR